MKTITEASWETLAQPGSMGEWRQIRRFALEKLVAIVANDSPHLTVEKAMLVIDSFFTNKMFPTWGNSTSMTEWHETRIEMYILKHFTHEFRRDVLAQSFTD